MSEKKTQIPCPACGARSYDPAPRRWHSLLGLCVWCYGEPSTRREALDRWRCQQVDRRPLPEPTKAPPGSRAKVDELARRRAAGLQLFHPDDATAADCIPADWLTDDEDDGRLDRAADRQASRQAIRPAVDPSAQAVRAVGVELDRTRRELRFRARPIYRGVKVRLGTYPTHALAAAAVDRFSRELGSRAGGKLADYSRLTGPCAAVVRTPAGWLEIEYPPTVDQQTADQAARRLANRYTSSQEAYRHWQQLLVDEAAWERQKRRREKWRNHTKTGA